MSPGEVGRITELTSSGVRIQVVKFHGNKLPDREPGKHLWVMLAMFRVQPALGDRFDLDRENLLTIEGPGCYWCEHPWSEDVAAKPCGGDQ